MLSENVYAVYKRLLVLGVLSACLAVFGFSNMGESVYAVAPCIQDCEASVAMCDDSCATSCSDQDDATCNTCLANCVAPYNRCMAHAVSCSSGSLSYTPACEVSYGIHCPIINGTPACTDNDGAHWGYLLTCSTVGGGSCVACPDHNWSCTGSNGASACFP
jgi:hypothetical protein